MFNQQAIECQQNLASLNIFLIKNIYFKLSKLSNYNLLLKGFNIQGRSYEQLLQMQIPKVQKMQSTCQYLFVLLGSAHVKAAHKMLMKLTPALVKFLPGRT